MLGTPIWAGSVSSPVRAYLTAHRSSFRRTAFFCTHGGSSAPKVFDEMAAICKTRPLACLALTEREIRAGDYGGKLREFLDRLAPADAG